MKTARTCVLIFVPILADNAGSDDGVRQDAEHNTLEACAPKRGLFWTWFVDNSPPHSKR